MIFVALLASLGFAASSHANNLHVGVVHGDRDYASAQRSTAQDSYAVVDGARATYLSLLREAKRDEQASYVIHYDPKGRGGFLSGSNMKTHVFENSRARHFVAQGESHPTEYPARVQGGLSKLSRNEWKHRYFYFYGEQPSAEPTTRSYDSGTPDRDFSLPELSQLIVDTRPDPQLPWTRAVIQSCNVENLEWVISLVGVVEELVIPLGTVSSLPPLFATLWSPGQTPATRVTGTRWEWIQLKLDPSLKRLSSLLELAKKNRVPRTTAMDETFSTADSKTGPWRISMSEFPLWAEQWENFTPELMNSFHELTQSYPQIRKLKIQVSD